jgi:AcrR family transcriptional regulator
VASRARILDAMALVVYERGYAQATVTEVCARCGIARCTFYETFADLKGCFLALMDDVHEHVRAVIAQAFDAHDHWQSALRAALLCLLELFDVQPKLARVWFVETLAAGAWALERRERHLAALTRMIAERWPVPADIDHTSLTPASAMESVLGMIRTHLLSSPELLAPMMGLIATIYLGPHEAAKETTRCRDLARDSRVRATPTIAQNIAPDPVAIPDTLLNAKAHRARDCIRYLAAHPDASNREIAAAVGIARDDQISTTLARLAAVGLLEKRPAPPGGANAWSLSHHGQRVARALQDSDDYHPCASPRLPRRVFT